jgi:hypothetical protein
MQRATSIISETKIGAREADKTPQGDFSLNHRDLVAVVGFTVGFRRADEQGYGEGLFVCLHADDAGMVLEELNTIHSPVDGSDHYTVEYGRQSLDRTLRAAEVNEWLSKLRFVRDFEEAELQSYRDHV